ncbi:hypothetical protein NP233_g7418 [Leucocoprinus birnbaumii]|uniref:Secreted protein n=1 Tax=Leucocoprinus birnbaumii TaxID=56174 RepID=A0AAD5YUS3_9AGAR|nr:hypothetical protein NP233_g7418 [Leucocoprinus birnbaumii]
MPASGLRLLLAIAINLSGVFTVLATPSAAPDNTVVINSATSYCMIMPRTLHTNIGDSEHPGGMQSCCSSAAQTDPSQCSLPDNFWRDVDYRTGTGSGKYVQLTGCIRPETLNRLNPKDSGGQYDSSGGAGGRGNPAGSVCKGYNHYVELVEPAGPRACIRCCENTSDCPLNKDTAGCPQVIPGNYFNCG